MVGQISPVTASGGNRDGDAEWEGFVWRMRRMIDNGTFKRVAREALLEPRVLFAMREMAAWCRPHQRARAERETREATARAAALAHFRSHRRNYIDPLTRVQMPPVRIGAEYRTPQQVRRNTDNARAWAHRVAADPEKVLAQHTTHLPYERWVILRPGYGPVRNLDEFWEQRVNRDVRLLRRRRKRGVIHPVGMAHARAIQITVAVLDVNGGRFPKPTMLPEVL